MKIRYAAILAALTIGIFSLNPTGAQSNDVPTWQFSVKFVCGEAQGEGDKVAYLNDTKGGGTDADRDPVTPGVYETAINLHNPNEKAVEGARVPRNTASTDDDFSKGFRKKALVLYPTARVNDTPPQAAAPAAGEAPVPGPVGKPPPEDDFEVGQPPGFWVAPDPLDEDWGLEIDCRDIREVLLGRRCLARNGVVSVEPQDPCQEVEPDPRAFAPLIKGYVVIEERSKLPLDVTALYTGYIHSASTSDPCQMDCGTVQVQPQGQPTGFSEEIETITPKRIEDDDDD